jgi:hypothetical protein
MMKFNVRRKLLTNLVAAGVFVPLVACGKSNFIGNIFMKKEVVLDVVLFSYLSRPIFDVYLNGSDIGVASSYGGGRAVMTAVTIPLGPQTLTWRLDGPAGTAGNGDTVTVKNSLSFTADQIPADSHYLGVHIYPDGTAELVSSVNFPEPTPKGEKIYKEKHLHGR